MSTNDHVDAATDDAKGKVKEGYGKLTNDESAEAEGKMDQVKSDVKEGMADAKDKVKDIADKVTGNDH